MSDLKILGGDAAAIAEILQRRLLECGYPSDLLTADTLRVKDGNDRLLPDFAPEANDDVDFSAEKALDLLAEQGVIILDMPWISEEEEAEMEKRFRGLGYIE